MQHTYKKVGQDKRMVGSIFGLEVEPRNAFRSEDLQCEVKGCNKPSYTVVWQNDIVHGLFVCRHHYGIVAILRDDNTTTGADVET